MTKSSHSPDQIEFDPVDLQNLENKKTEANPLKNEVLSQKGLQKDMSPSNLKIFGNEYFLNYEVSWLKFNWRVLELAQNENLPLLERVKFIGIVCSNLDEFFQKRVGGLKRQLHAGVSELTVDGKTPAEQLQAIRKDVQKMILKYRSCYLDELVPRLNKHGIQIREYSELNKDLQKKADEYFEKQIYPIITPLAVDEAHPFPFISNKSRSLAIKLRSSKSDEFLFARIKIPANRPRWIQLEHSNDHAVLLSVKDLITEKINRFFPGG